MPDLDLDAIEARAHAATAPPWIFWDYDPTRHDLHGVSWGGCNRIVTNTPRPDEQFIAAARADVPALVAAVRRLRAEVAAEQARYAKLAHNFDAAVLAKLAATRHAHALKAEVASLKHTRTVGTARVIGPHGTP